MKKKIMVVDDSKVFRAYIGKTLEEAGYEVCLSPNAEHALSNLAKEKPDLITVDVAMPGMDGFELCEQVRQLPNDDGLDLSHTPLILITSSDPVASREKGFKVGAIDFISKPFESHELQYAANKILNPETLFNEMSVLIVEDSKMNRVMINQILKELGVNTVMAENGAVALETLRAQKDFFDLIITDYQMPEMNGLELCQHTRGETLIDSDAPIIFLSGSSEQHHVLKAFDHGANDYLFKPFFREGLLARVRTHLNSRLLLKERQMKFDTLESKFSKRSHEVILTQKATIELLGSLAEYRDSDTGQHISRTQKYMEMIAHEIIKLPKYKNTLDLEWVEDVIAGAPLHDVGKVGIKDSILLKPGPLTDDEFEIMKTHAEIGQKALQSAEKELGFKNFLKQAALIAGYHHEKWDGTGYPNGLQGEDIPLCARIMAIADVYDALVSKRVYKDIMSHKKACDIINEGKGKHFDPTLVDIFNSLSEEFKRIRKQFPDR